MEHRFNKSNADKPEEGICITLNICGAAPVFFSSAGSRSIFTADFSILLFTMSLFFLIFRIIGFYFIALSLYSNKYFIAGYLF